jgi:hypothetical protein
MLSLSLVYTSNYFNLFPQSQSKNNIIILKLSWLFRISYSYSYSYAPETKLEAVREDEDGGFSFSST